MTHSAYVQDPDGNGVELHYTVPREYWERDVNAALSFFELLPSTGPEARHDNTAYTRFEGQQ